MPTESFTEALTRLDPASRALLDLSLRRGMRTEEIAELLGADAGHVTETRDDALRRVALDVGMGDDEVRARLAELPAEEWLGGPPPAAGPPVDAEAAPTEAPAAGAEPEPDTHAEADGGAAQVSEPSPAAEPDGAGSQVPEPPAGAGPDSTQTPALEPAGLETPRSEPDPPDAVAAEAGAPDRSPPPRRTRGVMWPLLAGLLVAVAVVLAVVLGGSGGDKKVSSASRPAPRPHAAPTKPQQPSKPSRSPSAKLAAVGGGGGGKLTGTARLDGRRLHLDLAGLPAPRGGTYAVWLYNSVLDARRIGVSGRRHIQLDATLPPNWRRYRWLDVSRQRAGNPNHSGVSVARVATAKLTR